MSQILFYLSYAARNLWRSRRWSAFALLSVAAGVATIVALRGLGLSITQSLTDNVRSSLKGDIVLSQGGGGLGFDIGGNDSGIPASAVDALRSYADQRDWQMEAFSRIGGTQITAVDEARVGRPQFVTSIFVDPQTYPLTDDITAIDPAGVPLSALFQGGNEVVISENLAQSENIAVGDTVRVSGTDQPFVVRGIVPTYQEAGLQDLFASFFGFAYFDVAITETVLTEISNDPTHITFVLPDGTSSEEIENSTRDIITLPALYNVYVQTDNVPRQLRVNQQISDIISRFVVIMGLGAMLIGGIGIINTMLVMVRRRTNEIAAMKTFGLKGRQVAWLFFAEAFLIGLVGSVIGTLLGVVLTGFANGFGSAVIQQPLRWAIYPEAIGFGLAIGLAVSLVFGVVPVLTASRIRPGIILRPNDTHVAAIGVFYSLIALVLVTLVCGVIAGQIIGNTLVGIIFVAVTFVILGLLVLVLWLVVWFLGKLPAFRSIDLRLAQRNLSTGRTRTATTLLALSAGMFALSSIAFFGAAAREILNFTLSETFGGNVLVFSVLPQQLAQPLIDNRLDSIDGVEYRTRIITYGGPILRYNDREWDDLMTVDPEELSRQINEAFRRGDFEESQRLSELLRNSLQNYMQVTVRDTTNPNPQEIELVAGRALSAADRGQPVGVLILDDSWVSVGFQLGDRVTLQIDNQTIEIEIVGIAPVVDVENFQSGLDGDLIIPGGVISQTPGFALNIAQVREDKLNEALLSLSALPLVYSIDISFIDGVIGRLINQFAALPTLVGILSLGAAAVIMANTVALATLERRRQIGILKAVGLRRGRVLRIMLLENVLVTLVGGLIGIGLSALGVWIMTSFGLTAAIAIPREAVPIAALLLLASAGIGVAATALSAGPAVRERVLNVLRYE